MCAALRGADPLLDRDRSKNEEVEVNFGNGAAPFVFDLDQLVRADQDVQGRAVHGYALPVRVIPLNSEAGSCVSGHSSQS